MDHNSKAKQIIQTFQDFEKGLLADLFPSTSVVQPSDDLDLVPSTSAAASTSTSASVSADASLSDSIQVSTSQQPSTSGQRSIGYC